MTSLEAYKHFLLLINKNDSNTNVNISKGEFVLLFNSQKRVWLNEKLSEKRISILCYKHNGCAN